MKYLKTFESHNPVNEEFTQFDLNKWLASAAGVLSTALNVVLLKWARIPGIWKNIGQYHTLMNVVKHLSETAELHGHDASQKEWISLVKDFAKERGEEGVVKYSQITSGPSISDLSMAYTLMSYDGDLEEDIKESIDLINSLDPEKKEKVKDVEETLEQFSKLIMNYKSNQKSISTSQL